MVREKEDYYSNMESQRRQSSFRQEKSEFIEKVVQIHRVSKKTKGGNKIGFSALAVVGDGKGRVGVGLGKAGDVASAIRKGVTIAKKKMIDVPMKNDSIPFPITLKWKAAKVLLQPAPVGSGVIAGGAIRSVVSAAGIKNISSKVLGTNNQASNVYATIAALKEMSSMHARAKIKTKLQFNKTK